MEQEAKLDQLQPVCVCDGLLNMWSLFPTGQTLFSSVDAAPPTMAPTTAPTTSAAATKELIDSFLKKPREELLQCKTPNVTLPKDELCSCCSGIICPLQLPEKNTSEGVVLVNRLLQMKEISGEKGGTRFLSILLPIESNQSSPSMHLYEDKWSFLSNDFGFPKKDSIRVAQKHGVVHF